MKLLVAFASLVLAISAATDQELWAEFKAKYGRLNHGFREEKYRFQIFQQSLRSIEEHNARYERGEVSYYLGVNQFSDRTQEEFRSLLTTKKPNLKVTEVFKPQPNYVAPDTVDWRDRGAVLEVKNQGQCGSCWAFSVTGALEGQNALKYGKSISLSEQELVDCTFAYGNGGCDGGYMESGFNYIINSGISTEGAYSYRAVNGNCQNYTQRADVRVSSYTEVENNEIALKEAVGSIGPISVAINATYISQYAGGVLDVPACTQPIDHAVLAVGYGSEGGLDYWLLKNSWGAEWGDNGYFKLARNKNGQCGISTWNVYPNVY